MTLKTISAPTIRDALAEARRLFGADAVMLQSTPAAAGALASVTVAFGGSEPPVSVRPVPAPAPAVQAAPAPRAYGYGPARRNVSPAEAERSSVPAPAWAEAPRVVQPVTFETLARPIATPPLEAPAASPASDASEIQSLRARLARLEAALAAATFAAPAAAAPVATRRAPLVLVGPGGSGKTSLALRLGVRPECVGAASVAVIVVAPEAGPFVDPGPTFWETGVPCAVVRTADDVREAMETLAGADLIVVDTPALPLDPARGAAAVRRLGAVLAPLAPLDVLAVLDAARSPNALGLDALAAIGLRPDGLALTRLDEAAPGAARRLRERTGQTVRIASTGDGPDALVTDDALADAPAPPAPSEASLPAWLLEEPFADRSSASHAVLPVFDPVFS